jgi:hypothetical protein
MNDKELKLFKKLRKASDVLDNAFTDVLNSDKPALTVIQYEKIKDVFKEADEYLKNADEQEKKAID